MANTILQIVKRACYVVIEYTSSVLGLLGFSLVGWLVIFAPIFVVLFITLDVAPFHRSILRSILRQPGP